MDKNYCQAAGCFSGGIRRRLLELPPELQGSVREICLRAGRPLALAGFRETYFPGREAGFFPALPPEPYLVTGAELQEYLRVLTEYSVQTYQDEINAGYITIQGGHRAGVAGTCVCREGRIHTVHQISSLSLRIARQIPGAAAELVHTLYPDRVRSTLIAGAPASGKTTLLRDMARCLSNGLPGYYTRVSLIDERGELAAVRQGIPQYDVGVLTDVFDSCPKGEGMRMAIRAMAPEALLLDEISGEEDAASILQSLNAGAAVIASVHASSLDELCRNRHIRELIDRGAFQRIVLLQGADVPCRIARIAEPRELLPC